VGVLNVTPDSFSDGGKYMDPDAAFAQAVAIEDAGADIVDIGAESTRPGSTRISEAEELRRLIPVLKRLKGKLSIPISIDTYKSGVAQNALELGAEIINDPSGLTWDPDLARVVSNFNAGLILNHMRGTPDQWLRMPPLKNPAAVVAQELEAAVNRAVLTGLDRKRVVIDPGLGFGKRKEQNADILAHLSVLARQELPIMVGASRKHFLAKETTEFTEFATAAAVTISILRGAHLVRVHDVAAMKVVAEVADEVLRAEAAVIEANAADTDNKNASRVARRESSGPDPRNERRPLVPFRKPGARPGTSPSGPPRPRNPR
jgi:dihydropteroate synthase